MDFVHLRRAYNDLTLLLGRYKNCSARISDADRDMLCRAFDKIKEINDYAAMLHVYETLVHSGALAPQPTTDPQDLHLYMHWLQGQLKLVDFNQGQALLDQARGWHPAHRPLIDLEILYLWFYDRTRLDGQIIAQGIPDPVPENLLTIYGEHLIRMKQHDQAQALAFLANTDPRRRHDLALLMVNAARNPDQKLVWFNHFLAAQKMAALRLKSPQGQFQIDNLTVQARPPVPAAGQPLVSIITTAYNCAEYLETSANSILNQSWRNLELLIVDDCSDHATRAKIRDLAARDPRVIPIFRSENGGTYIAKSEAMARANGDYVVFHDADDWAHPDKISQEVSALDSEPERVCWCSGWARIDENGAFIMQLSGKYAHPNPAGSLLRHPMVYNRIGGFDPVRTGADSAYKRRIQLEFGPRSLRTDPKVLVLGRHHSDSLTQVGATSMANFGWSPSRALYRSNWVDAMVLNDSHNWAPLGMRKTPIKIPYTLEDVQIFDPLRRIGLGQLFEDILLIVQGRLSDRHLTQMHRLALALHQTGYRMGIYFEDYPVNKDTWQFRTLQQMDHIHFYGDLGKPRAKICLLVKSDARGYDMRVLTRELISVENHLFARPIPQAPLPPSHQEALFMLPPDPHQQYERLAKIDKGRLILLTSHDEPHVKHITESPFGLRVVADPAGHCPQSLVLCGPDWSTEHRIEAAMIAKYLGRHFLHTPQHLRDMPQIKATILETQIPCEPAPETLPVSARTGMEFVADFAKTLSTHLADRTALNLEWRLNLPA